MFLADFQGFYNDTKLKHALLKIFQMIKPVSVPSLPSVSKNINKYTFSFHLLRNSLPFDLKEISKLFVSTWFYRVTTPFSNFAPSFSRGKKGKPEDLWKSPEIYYTKSPSSHALVEILTRLFWESCSFMNTYTFLKTAHTKPKNAKTKKLIFERLPIKTER